MKRFFEKILALLRVHSVAAGLEVSDEILRLVSYDGKTWRLNSMRLEPGVLENGRVKNREAFKAALLALKEKVMKRKKGTFNVVLCLSSLRAYIQTFSLPSAKGEDFEQAVELNLKMAS